MLQLTHIPSDTTIETPLPSKFEVVLRSNNIPVVVIDVPTLLLLILSVFVIEIVSGPLAAAVGRLMSAEPKI